MHVPLPEIFMPLVLQARNNSEPVKPGHRDTNRFEDREA